MHAAINYFDLGASLYTPATHPRLGDLLRGGGCAPRSCIACLEDSIHDAQIPAALDNLRQALGALPPSTRLTPKRFIRPRDPQLLEVLLRLEHIDKIDGFVLPKLDLDSLDAYQRVIAHAPTRRPFAYMPTLETVQTFDPEAMRCLRRRLEKWEVPVICLRIGGNDLMKLLGLKRMRGMTLYDTPLRILIDQLIITFRPYGFELSAPVFDLLDDTETLQREIAMDLNYGLYAKTAIHPTQISVIEAGFADFIARHHEQAQSLLQEQCEAVFKLDGQMLESRCHTAWAQRVAHLAERRKLWGR